MKYTLIFIYRLLNIIFFVLQLIAGAIYFFLLPVWLILGYLFYGDDYIDKDPLDHWNNIFDTICYPLDKFKEFIDDIDDNKYNFIKDFWK